MLGSQLGNKLVWIVFVYLGYMLGSIELQLLLSLSVFMRLFVLLSKVLYLLMVGFIFGLQCRILLVIKKHSFGNIGNM